MSVRILQGDCREMMRTLPEGSVHCCVTSPPYWGLRDYGHAGQLGLEPTPEDYIANMVEVFREVKRVLRDDGTLWLNLGDSYAGAGYSNHANTGGAKRENGGKPKHLSNSGLKNKDLVGIPWMVAFALRADGWYLRQDIIWHKPNPMPESVTDRCTKAHEYMFLMSKSPTYFYDHDAIKEKAIHEGRVVKASGDEAKNRKKGEHGRTASGFTNHDTVVTNRNKRSVWTVTTKPFRGAHFATFPPALIEPCIKAGCPQGGTVIDPFGGAGTTGLVSERLGRNAILCELNPEYISIAEKRLTGESPLFSRVEK